MLACQSTYSQVLRIVPCMFFRVAGLVFTPCCEPYLSSEYGMEYVNESPVKLLDKLLHGMKQTDDEEVGPL